jgi:hypothetical protein
MTVSISQAHNEARLNGTLAFLDTGSAHARIRIYDGTRPAPNGSATTLLVEIALDKPSGSVANNQLTLASSDLPLNSNNGTATWARIINGNGDWVMDCDVSDQAGSGEIKLTQVQLYAGGKTQLISGVFG